MKCQSDVEILYDDLKDSFAELNAARPSPVRVRRAFASFVGLTQQLTAAMRRDFSAHTATSWSPSEFSGWNSVSQLFKSLRNIDQHESSVLILVRECQTIRPFEGSSALLSFEGTWELHDQLADAPPEGLVTVRADPVTGEPTDKAIPLESRERTFLLHSRTEEIRRLLEAAGRSDVHDLSAECLKILTSYVEFYRGRLASET